MTPWCHSSMTQQIRCFRITKTILSFILQGEQTDVLLDPGDPNKMLEANEDTIWYVYEAKRYESITTRNAIEAFLASGAIEELVTQAPVEPLESEPCPAFD